MARSQKQKLKLLYLMRCLLQNSDEAHPVGIAQMVEMLESCGIPAERKSLYADLEALREFGLDIVQTRGKTVGYYVASREFELPELKLLVDSVQSSKFITQKKTLSLIKKIESLASVHDARLLQRQVYVRNRVKSMNESVYYHVDALSAAITDDRTVRFRYYEYTVSKERRFRRAGKVYEVSPFALLWDNENYYLLAWDDEAGTMKHYRVDKMADIERTDTPRRGREAFERVDMSEYTKHVFGMFGGQPEQVRLRFAGHLAGAVLDRFGRDLLLVPDGEQDFIVTVRAQISPQFFAWVFGFGDEVEILTPPSVREAFRAQAQRTAQKNAPL
jgi:predicted DNA-binding transcriptional regulator YafY